MFQKFIVATGAALQMIKLVLSSLAQLAKHLTWAIFKIFKNVLSLSF